MYKSTKENKGEYNLKTFIKRGHYCPVKVD